MCASSRAGVMVESPCTTLYVEPAVHTRAHLAKALYPWSLVEPCGECGAMWSLVEPCGALWSPAELCSQAVLEFLKVLSIPLTVCSFTLVSPLGKQFLSPFL